MAAGFVQTSQTLGTGYATPYSDTNNLGTDYFIKRPDLLPDVVDNWNNREFADMLMLNGQELVTKSEIVSNYEQGPLFKSVALATVTSASASSATITLTTDSHTSVGSILNGGSTVRRSPLMERSIIKLPNRREIRVQSKSTTDGGEGTTYVVTKSDLAADSGFNLGTYLTGILASAPTQRYAIVSTASAERSTEPLEGLESPLLRYTNRLQIFRTHSEITGSAAGDIYEVNFTKGQDPQAPGMEGMYWYSKQRLEQGYNHRVMMGMQFMFGRGGAFVDAEGGKLAVTTTGVEGYVRAYGNTYDYTLGNFQLSDLLALVARIKFQKGPTDYLLVAGYGLYAQIQTVLINLPGMNYIRPDEFGNGDSRKKFVSFGANGFNYGGINFWLQESPTFSHPELLGIPGYDYIDQGVLIPWSANGGTAVTSYDNGVMERIKLQNLTIRYKLNGADPNHRDRRMVEYNRGIGITGVDSTKHEMLTHEGIQMVKLRNFIWLERASS